MISHAYARIVTRARQFSLPDWSLLLEALLTISASSAAIHFQPFEKVGRMASAPVNGRHSGPPDRVVWAVRVCARRVPWRAVCFQQGLAAQMMLRRRGFDSTLYFGAAPKGPGGVSAHVWVKWGDREVIGCEEASNFAILATFPRKGNRTGGPRLPRRFEYD